MQALSMERLLEATRIIAGLGVFPFPVNDTTMAIIGEVIKSDKELDLILCFKDRPSKTLPELMEVSPFSQEETVALCDALAKKGLIFNQPNTQGVMVYRLLPLMNVGLMEYRFMTPLSFTEDDKRLARLFKDLIDQVREQLKANLENISKMLPHLPPVDRTVPVRTSEDGKPIKVISVSKAIEPTQVILPSQSVEEIISKFDDIAVGYCFCRQKRMALGEYCHTNAPLENCFTFGKSARHTVAQGFARKVTKEEALDILRRAEEAGLVHKAFHPNSQISKPETSICNCCKDCCDTFNLWREGAFPMINATYFLSVIDLEKCIGCGICEERCPTDAISISEGVLTREEKHCIGCGVCARFCPEGAISLQEGERRVAVLPPRLR